MNAWEDIVDDRVEEGKLIRYDQVRMMLENDGLVRCQLNTYMKKKTSEIKMNMEAD